VPVCFPTALGSPIPVRPGLGLTIIVVAEGWSDGRAFQEALMDLWEQLTDIPPLDRLDTEAGNCSVYAVFDPDDTTPLGIVVDIAGQMTSDPDDVLAFLGNLSLVELGGSGTIDNALTELPWPNAGATAYATTLLVALVNPSRAAGRGEWLGEQRFTVPYHVMVNADTAGVATVAKALGRLVGLGDEHAVDHEVPVFARGRPAANIVSTDYEALAVDGAVWDPQAPFRESPKFERRPVEADGLSYLAMEEHSLMELPPTGEPGPEVTASGFGPSGRRMLAPWSGSEPDSIAAQELHYDRAGFGSIEDLDQVSGIPNRVGSGSEDSWIYSVDVDPVRGLVLRDLRIRTYMDHDDTRHWFEQPVAEWIEFVALEVAVADSPGSSESQTFPIDFSDAVETHAEQGWDAVADSSFQEGVLLQATFALAGSSPATSAVVTIELACAFREPRPDFDPPGSVVGCYCIPQTSLRQVDPDLVGLSDADFAGTVISFDASVRAVADVMSPEEMVAHMKAALTEPGPTAPDEAAVAASFPASPAVSYASLFTDMWNAGQSMALPGAYELLEGIEWNWVPSLFLPVPVPVPTEPLASLREAFRLALAAWFYIFDYVEHLAPRSEDVPTESQPSPRRVQGVKRTVPCAADRSTPGGPYRGLRHTTVWLPWPASADGTVPHLVHKEDGQAGYDNIHIHGTMGSVGDIPADDLLATARVMAPGCGHSCFHLHWRWGNSTYFVTTTSAPAPIDAIALSLTAGLHDTLLGLFELDASQDDEDTAALVASIPRALASYVGVPPLGAQFLGWSSQGARSKRRVVVGAPMIPPNQSLDLTIADRPAAVGAPLPGTAVGDWVKTVELRTSVRFDDEFDARWRHCTHEVGFAVALRYQPCGAELLFRVNDFLAFRDVLYLPQWLRVLVASDTDLQSMFMVDTPEYSASRAITKAYDIIPFLDSVAVGDTGDPRHLVPSTATGSTPDPQRPGIDLEHL